MRDKIPAPPTRVVLAAEFDGPRRSPTEDEIRVWVVPLDKPSADPAKLYGCLTPDERARADRYRAAHARHQFVTTRGLLRRILGNELGVAPEGVPLTYGPAGKPLLAGGAAAVHFNLSHTDGLAVIALARRPVGVDVERVRAVSDPAVLVRRFFSPGERDAFDALPEPLRPAGFFRGWTCKEALIKASGLSIAYLDTFDVELHPAWPAKLLAARHAGLSGAGWRLLAWEPAPGYTAALAVEGTGCLELGT
jgi:4'-phosphopantetheinyl transferase